MVVDIAERKGALRASVRAHRAALVPDDRDTASLTLHLAELTRLVGATTVTCFLPTPTEPDTRPYVRWAREHGVRVLLPIPRPDGLLDWSLDDGAAPVRGSLGVPEPLGARLGTGAVEAAELMIVPAAAVDRTGVRLGWGRGYFDKTLADMGKCPPVYAVVFPLEIVDEVPREPHDHPVDGAVTAAGIVRFT